MNEKTAAIDAFEQIRDAHGALPTKNASIIEDDAPARLRFSLYSPGELDGSEPRELSLEMLAKLGAEGTLRADIEKLAAQMGPLFGGGEPESLESWQLAAKAAQVGMAIHAAAQQEPEVLLSEAPVRKCAIVDVSRGKRRGCWYWALIPVDAGGGDEYRRFLPDGIWCRKLGEGCWALAQVEEIPESLDSLVVGVLQLDFKGASLADARVIATTMRQKGLPSVKVADDGCNGSALIGASDVLSFETGELEAEDAPILSDILRAVAQMHMQGARLDVIKSTPEQQFMAFPALLGYLWFDFVRRGKEVRVGICAECGLPFGKSSRGGSRKRFCSPSCSAKFRSREKREQ